MVIRIDRGTAPGEIRCNGDPPFLDREPPRLRVVAVGGERGIAHQLAETAFGPERCPRRSHRLVVRHHGASHRPTTTRARSNPATEVAAPAKRNQPLPRTRSSNSRPP